MSASQSQPIRVLLVDDSALVRKVVSTSLQPFSDIQIVGTAIDPIIAKEKIAALNPDVITLDIEMPRMDGITFLKLLMKEQPTPVIIMSSLTAAGSDKAFEALQAGAVEVMQKPSGWCSAESDGTRLAEKIRVAARAKLRAVEPAPLPQRPPAVPRAERTTLPPATLNRRLILVGASTGGTEAIKSLLLSLDAHLPAICIVQHIPANFSRAFADRLNSICPMEVREARHGDRTRPGLALVAPGGRHMLLERSGDHYEIKLSNGPAIHHQRPAVDVLFDSGLKAGAAPHCTAAILTGMGADGAAGLLRLRQSGASTISQDEATSVVFGMPREAIRLGAAQHVLPLHEIGRKIEQLSRAKKIES